MKKINLMTLTLFFIYHFFSCDNDKNRADYLKNTIEIYSDFIEIDELVGRPYDIVICDSLIIYYDYYDKLIYSVYDLKNNIFKGRFLSVGGGPNEVLPPLDILSSNNNLIVYQRNSAIIHNIDLPDFVISKSITINSLNGWKPEGFVRTKDYYIGFGFFDNGRFQILDSDTQFLTECGEYPFSGKNMNNMSAFMTYQGPKCANPDSNYFVASSKYSDHIAFYEVINGEVSKLKEYSSHDANVTLHNNGVQINDNCVMSYTYAYGTTNYCYMLYCGKTYIENDRRTRGGQLIIMFDWHGNHIKTFKADCAIQSFCVDEKNNMIYASVLDKNYEYLIAKFQY